MKKFSTLLDVIVWALMPEKLSSHLLSLIGATGREPLPMLGMMEPDEVLDETASMSIEGKPHTVIQVAASALWFTRAVWFQGPPLLWNSKKLWTVWEKVEKEVVKLSAEPAPATFAQENLELAWSQVQQTHVVSQGTDEVVPRISPKSFTAHWDTFKPTYGRDPRPEVESTSDQLTGIPICRFRHTGTEPSQCVEKHAQHRTPDSHWWGSETNRNCCCC